MNKYQWRTIGFVPDGAGWHAEYSGDDGERIIVPIAGWLIEEETAVDPNGNYVAEDGPRERRVVAADWSGAEVEPCSNCSNFKCILPPSKIPNSSEKQ